MSAAAQRPGGAPLRNFPGLRAGDRVRVYADADSRSELQGVATLVRYVARPAGRRPLEAWVVELELAGGGVKRTLRMVHPEDRVE